MAAEESAQRRVEEKRRERSEAAAWLEGRVEVGRMDLLREGRLGGIEREARMVWASKERVVTAPGVAVRREVYG